MKLDAWIRTLRKKRRKAREKARFVALGRLPWTAGYEDYKREEIVRALQTEAMKSGSPPANYGYRLDERIIEYPWLFGRLPAGPGRLLDAGSILNFDYILDHPSLAGKNLHICTLAPEPNCFWKKGVSYLFEDLRRLPYMDGLFDTVVSLSTLEHVGMDNSMLYSPNSGREQNPKECLTAARELRRVMKPGGVAYLSVPFGKAANLGWFQVFDQTMVEELVAAFAPASSVAEYFRYHPDGWRQSSALDAANATVFNIHEAKGYDPDFAAAARAVCCVELRK
jgi:hypothetical protein